MVSRLRTNWACSYAASSVVVSPPVVAVLWWMASAAPGLNMDQQMYAFFGLHIPFLVVSVAALLAVQQRLLLGPLRRRILVPGCCYAAVLAWPAMVAAVIVGELLALPKPMLDERTPAPLAWWTNFVLGWVILVAACGTLLVWSARLQAAITTTVE